MGVAFTLGFFGVLILIPIALIVIAIMGIVFFIVGLVLRKIHKKAKKRKIYPIVLMVIGAVLVVSSSVAFFTPSINPFMTVLTSSEDSEGTGEHKKEYLPPPEQARRQSVSIIESVQNKDTEALKTMFCEKAKNELDLDSELKTFIEFIDGNIVSYDEPWGMAGGMSTTPKDGIVKQRLDGHIANIETDKDKRYYIGLNSYNINEEKPELIGLAYLYIYDEDVFTSENEYPDHGRYDVGVDIR